MEERTALDDIGTKIGVLGVYKRRDDFSPPSSRRNSFLLLFHPSEVYPNPIIKAISLTSRNSEFQVNNYQLKEFVNISYHSLTQREAHSLAHYEREHGLEQVASAQTQP